MSASGPARIAMTLPPSRRALGGAERCSASTSSSTSPSCWCWRCSSARRRCCGGWPTTTQTPQYLDVAAELTGALLPDADAPPAENQKALDALHRKLRFDLALYRPRRHHDRHGRPAAAALRSAARAHRLAARPGRPDLHPAAARRPLAGRPPGARAAEPDPSGSSAASPCWRSPIAVGAYPVVRGLGRRLERLKDGVEQLGGGDLGARVKVEGRDEVAALAAELQPLGPAHRGAGRRPSPAARQLQPRAAHAARPHRRRRLAAGRAGRRQDARGAEARHRRARPADRGDPAGEPARSRARPRAARAGRPAGARRRGGRALRPRGERRSRSPSRATACCCAAWSATCWRTRGATPATGRSRSAVRREGGARRARGLATTGRACRPTSASASSSRSTACAATARERPRQRARPRPGARHRRPPRRQRRFALRQKAAAAASGSTCRRRLGA